jgi:hypothetical protein
MLVALPLCVCNAVSFVAKGEARYSATTGVQVTDNDDGTFTLAATDGKFIGIVRGKMDPELACFAQDFEGELENPARQIVVDAKSWKEIFGGGVARNAKVMVSIWSDGQTIHLRRWENAESVRMVSTVCMEGRFPPWENVIPKAGAKAILDIDAPMLGQAIMAASKMIGTDDEHRGFRVGFYPGASGGELFGISGWRYDPDVTFDGLVVPLKLMDEPAPKKAWEEPPEPETEVAEAPVADVPIEVTEVPVATADAVQGLRERHRRRKKMGMPAPETPAS